MSARVGLLGLGSNVGDRRARLQAAVDALPAAGVEVLASSSTYDTDPVGEIREQASFLNACVQVQTALEPIDLLDAVKAIEQRLGRVGGVGEYPVDERVDRLVKLADQPGIGFLGPGLQFCDDSPFLLAGSDRAC